MFLAAKDGFLILNFPEMVSFERFMEICLYDPVEGYYHRDRGEIFGKKGDYYTSSHTHECFAHCLAEELLHWFYVLGKPARFHVCEMGAGDGNLADQIREYVAENYQDLERSLDYIEVDIDRGALPEEITGVVFSNEFFDALPVRRVLYKDQAYWEIFVHSSEGEIREVLQPLENPFIESYLEDGFDLLRSGWIYEVNIRALEVLKDLNERLLRGCIVTIDYGYMSSEYEDMATDQGTLACYQRHQITGNPYQNPGTQDITCHINFEMLMKWGEELGWSNQKLISQREFLCERGLPEILKVEEEEGLFRSDRLGDRLKLKELLLPGGISDRMRVLVQQVRLD